MKRFFLLLLLIAGVALALAALPRLPADTSGLTRAKYEGWAGVVRVWVAQSARIGTVSPILWLNRWGTRLEKGRDGVYLDIRAVPDAALLSLRESGIVEPDLVIYPAGLPDSPEGFLPIGIACAFREGLEPSDRAVPLLTGAACLIRDPGALPGLPGDLGDLRAACPERLLNGLTALCGGKRPAEGTAAALPGLDLGLRGETAPTTEPVGELLCRAPETEVTDDAYAAFRRGEADLLVGSLADARKAADAGGAAAITGECVWADEVLLASVVEKTDAHAAERADLCREYLALLLGEGQADAARAGALSVVRGAAAWAGDPVLAAVEAAAEGKPFLHDPYFGAPLPADSARLFTEGLLTADEAVSRLKSDAR